jgi:hypothetical protein
MSKNIHKFDDDLNNQIIEKLLHILQSIFDVDLMIEYKDFMLKPVSFGMAIHVEYSFKYGMVSVLAKNNEMTVSFVFDRDKCNNLYIPFNCTRCEVLVDDDLNFEKAVFNFYSTINKPKIETKYASKYVGSVLVSDPHHATIDIRRTIDKQGKFSTWITYDNFYSKLGDYTELNISELHKVFFTPDKHFEEFFVKIMMTLKTRPQEFSSVFTDYPTHTQIMHNKTLAVNFLNLLGDDYFNRFHVLEANLLLLDMQVI